MKIRRKKKEENRVNSCVWPAMHRITHKGQRGHDVAVVYREQYISKETPRPFVEGFKTIWTWGMRHEMKGEGDEGESGEGRKGGERVERRYRGRRGGMRGRVERRYREGGREMRGRVERGDEGESEVKV